MYKPLTQNIKTISSRPGGDQTMYYPREESLLSLDMLKLYQREYVIQQNPEDIDPGRWLDEGELSELPKRPSWKLKKSDPRRIG